MNPTFEKLINDFDSNQNHLKKARRFNIKEHFTTGKGYKTILAELSKGKDFKGIYVFWQNEQAVYTGISKKVIFRLNQHINGATHHSASLPIKLLKVNFPQDYGRKPRNEFNKKDITEGQKELMKMSVSFIPLEEDVKLYLFEVYVAVTLKCKYNHFETH